MTTMRRAGALAAATTALLLWAAPVGATSGLNCGDPGTWHNMPVDPANDPHGLDGNGDGVGCEDGSVFGPDGQPVTPPTTAPPPTEPPAPEPTEPPAPEPEVAPAPAPEGGAAPAAPVVGEPSYTG